MAEVCAIVGLLAMVGAGAAAWRLNQSQVKCGRWPRVVWPLSLVSALVLWLAYFPVNRGWLAWVALIPWLITLRYGQGRIYWASFAAGCLFGLLALQWMRLADPLMYLSWWGLAMVLGLHWWLFAVVLVQLMRRAWPLPLVAPLIWVGLEWVRANVDIGFSWYFLAHTQHAWLPYLGLVPVTGAYGISALVMLVNAVLAETIVRWSMQQAPKELECPWASWPAPNSMRGASAGLTRPSAQSRFYMLVCKFWPMADLAMWWLACFAWLVVNPSLAWRWQEMFPKQGSLRVIVVQPNEPQEVRNAPNEERQRRVLAEFRELIRQTAKLYQTVGSVHLILWPETSMPFDWVCVLPDKDGAPASVGGTSQEPPQQGKVVTVSVPQAGPGQVADKSVAANRHEQHPLAVARQEQDLAETILRDMARLVPTHWLVGVNTRLYQVATEDTQAHPEAQQSMFRVMRFNSALLVSPAGQVVGRYDKIYRIPFGEYLPLQDLFPWVRWLSPYEYEYSILPGQAAQTLALGEMGPAFGVLICYEDTVPHLPRQFFNRGGDPDFFVNISNDGWFKGSEEHEQHLAISRFRAAETRRALVRSVNMGISAVIDADGTVLTLPGNSWRQSKAQKAVFAAEVPLYSGVTVYVRWGDWFAWTCLGLTISLLLAGLARNLPRHQSMAVGSG